ncbi:2-succinylbenzoate--CoA ligase [Hibiscus syriacus]|uniref:2-succinylbenzoate--CoA ligase n=1 Tax=Hibiscus syriacus TaxID=106335 RepID=A0A6A2X062_HIBSY|nr:2-succinylbenzoate--CoA ligase [Hibiscus syriacus]
MSKFLWGGGMDRNKIRWVSWPNVCKSKEEGGLGVLNILNMNRALLGKWSWRFANERNAVWRRLICSKYNLDHASLLFNSKIPTKSSWIWRSVVNTDFKEDSFGPKFRSLCRIQVGSGQFIRFWQDIWAMECPRKVSFPRLFASSSNQSGKLIEFGEFSPLGWIWNIQLRRSLVDWEFDQWTNLMTIISYFSLSREASDALLWKGNVAGFYSVNSCVKICSQASQANSFWKKILWKGLVPPRIEGFVKLNVDATTSLDWKSNGIAGIMRDEEGIFLGSFKKASGPGPPILMELKAVNEGLFFFDSVRAGIKGRLIVESDCKMVVDWVKYEALCPSLYASIVRDIAVKLKELEGVIRWVARTTNIEADGLAKSGTTGKPKGVVISHTALIVQSLAKVAIVGYSDDDVYLHTTPLCHIGGLSSAMAMLMVGVCHKFMPKFEATLALKGIEQHHVTSLITVPAIMADLILSTRLKKSWKGSDSTFSETNPSPVRTRGVYVGKPAPHVEIKICNDGPSNVGRILTRGPHVILRYWDHQIPDKTLNSIEETWLDTGDIGFVDDHCNLWLVKRTNGRIKSGGENVYPEEVEAVLIHHPGVFSSIVVGIPDPCLAEVVVACIRLRENWQWSDDSSESSDQSNGLFLSSTILRRYGREKNLTEYALLNF